MHELARFRMVSKEISHFQTFHLIKPFPFLPIEHHCHNHSAPTTYSSSSSAHSRGLRVHKPDLETAESMLRSRLLLVGRIRSSGAEIGSCVKFKFLHPWQKQVYCIYTCDVRRRDKPLPVVNSQAKVASQIPFNIHEKNALEKRTRLVTHLKTRRIQSQCRLLPASYLLISPCNLVYNQLLDPLCLHPDILNCLYLPSLGCHLVSFFCVPFRPARPQSARVSSVCQSQRTEDL